MSVRSGRYKTYKREQRKVNVQSTFEKGMHFTNGAIDEGFMKLLVNYDLSVQGTSLVPRPGLRTSHLCFLDPSKTEVICVDKDDVEIIDSRECAEEDGNFYRQFIMRSGNRIFSVSSPKDDTDVLELTEIQIGGLRDTPVKVVRNTSAFKEDFVVVNPVYNEEEDVHGFTIDAGSYCSVVSTFGFGNHFYCVTNEGKLVQTVFDQQDKTYQFEEVPVKNIGASEAVSYGYNMLSTSPYAFSYRNGAGNVAIEGILPYSIEAGEENTLVMTPKKNEKINFRVYFSPDISKAYKIQWEWRNVGDSSWQVLQPLDKSPEYTFEANLDDTVKIKADGVYIDAVQIPFQSPGNNVMVRVQFYNVLDMTSVEQAMTMGFDFRVESYGNTDNVKQEQYDLTTAQGMTYWNNRLVLYGVVKDPSVLFISDLNEPGYFPYPNNVVLFDDPIISVKSFMGGLLVFTTSEVHLVELNSDGISFKDTVVQTNLFLQNGDEKFIQVVRNMVFFKSGDYFYMVVPKAQSQTGTLTIAPVSNNIKDFFNKFEHNIYVLLDEVYGFSGEIILKDFYNYLDYDDVHNVYYFEYEEQVTGRKGFLNVDLLYDTNLRSWRIYCYESATKLRTYRFDVTKRSSLVSCKKVLFEGSTSYYLEFYKWDALLASDFLLYNSIEEYEDIVDWFRSSYDYLLEHRIFYNWQFLDSGYRNEILEYLKRYREIQIQINDIDGINLKFGLDFFLDNDIRMRWYDYEIEHIIDPSHPNYGQLYVVRKEIPNIEVPLTTTLLGSDEYTEKQRERVWTLDQSRFPEVSLWKIRMPVSGKGAAPRIKFVSQNDCRFEFMSINWVCRTMNAR